MKRYLYIIISSILLTIVGLTLYSCRKQNITDSNEIAEKGGILTIQKAKGIFESQFMMTKSKGSIKAQEIFDPGNFAMLWDDARWDRNDIIESVDVPIEQTNKHWVWQKKVYAGDTVFVRIPTTQRMVIFKNLNLEATISYLLTLIPDGDYLLNNRRYDEHFNHGGDKGNFTGWASYHALDGEFVAAYKYDKGKVVDLKCFRVIYDRDLLLSDNMDVMMPEVEVMTKCADNEEWSGLGNEENPREIDAAVCTGVKCPDKPWVAPDPWERPEHWNDPNANQNPNTGDGNYGGGGGSSTDSDYDRPLPSQMVAHIASLIKTDNYYDLTAFMQSPVTSSSTRNQNVIIRGVTVTIRAISISGAYPNGARCNMYMNPVSYSYPSFPEGTGVTMHFRTSDSNGSMSITMLQSEYNKVF